MNQAVEENDFRRGLHELLANIASEIDPKMAGPYEEGSDTLLLEHGTRTLFFDRFLSLLGWSLGAAGDVAEEVRIKAGTTRFLDYVGLNQDSRAPALLVEAKAWDKPFVRAANASLRASEKQLIIEAIKHLNIGGTKAKSPVAGDWHDHVDQVRGYVQASKSNYDHEIPCAVLASGQWIVIFSAPAATFIEDRINEEHLLIFKGDEILEGAERLYRLLSRRRLGCVAPSHIRPAQINNHMSAATVAAAYHAVLISYETTGAKFFAKVPLILVYPAILLRRDDGTLFTVLDGHKALPMDVDRADANGQSLLNSHLFDVEAQAQALLQACSQYLGGELAAADLTDFPGFDAIADSGGSAGITAPRAAYVRPTRGAHDDWLIVTGDRTHYLRLRPEVACRFHAWSECRTVGQQIGNGAIGTAKTDTPRAFFVDGSPYHCAHQTISDRRGARCHIAPLDGRTCCQACNLQAVCWTGGELAQLPCGG